jgi:Tfp pilus assembly protein FimT
MKFLVALFATLAAIAVDGFSPSSMTNRMASTQLMAASRLDVGRSPTANPSIVGASEPVPTKIVSQRERNAMKDVVIDPDYWMAISVAALCPLILWYHPCTYGTFACC